MPNSLTLATDGMLQEDGADGCVKVVVRESEKTTVTQARETRHTIRAPSAAVVARPISAEHTVAVAPNTVVAATRVETQTVVKPGCGGNGGVAVDNGVVLHPFLMAGI